MSQDQSTDVKKELARVKAAERNRLPHMMEYQRKASLARSKARKVESTAKRLDEHTMDELIRIARQKCEVRNIDFAKYQDSILTALHILHDDGHVFSESRVHNLYTQTPSSENPIDQSQEDGDIADPSLESKM